jgi:hypothetical protein
MQSQPFEFDFDYSPAWRFVGKHMHWFPPLQNLAELYVRRAVGASEDGPTPPVCPPVHWCITYPNRYSSGLQSICAMAISKLSAATTRPRASLRSP